MSALHLGEDEIRFLTQIQRYSARLSENDRKLLLAMCAQVRADHAGVKHLLASSS